MSVSRYGCCCLGPTREKSSHIACRKYYLFVNKRLTTIIQCLFVDGSSEYNYLVKSYECSTAVEQNILRGERFFFGGYMSWRSRSKNIEVNPYWSYGVFLRMYPPLYAAQNSSQQAKPSCTIFPSHSSTKSLTLFLKVSVLLSILLWFSQKKEICIFG